MTQPGFENPARTPLPTPPQTRVTNAWTNVWREVIVFNKRRTARARMYANAMRRIR